MGNLGCSSSPLEVGGDAPYLCGRTMSVNSASRPFRSRPHTKRRGGAASHEPARMSLPDYAIETRGLIKTFPATKTMPEKTALKGVDLAIPRGSIFGLLGPNGAGKSTFINILAGLCQKTSGEVKLWGVDIDQHPAHRPRRHWRSAAGAGRRRLLHPARKPGDTGGALWGGQEGAAHR